VRRRRFTGNSRARSRRTPPSRAIAAVVAAASLAASAAAAQAAFTTNPSWRYVNPLRAVRDLQASRIDMGVDYSGSGPIRAIGTAKVIFANQDVGGPESCWGKTCAPPGSGMVVYRLLAGPFAGKYVYIVEHITVRARKGETVQAGQRIAVLHEGSPNLEIGWAAGHGAETLAVARRHQCACTDPGGWSSIEGRNFDRLLVWLGAPSGYVTSIPRGQHMPRGWPALPTRR
jgi:hypothetical protein